MSKQKSIRTSHLNPSLVKQTGKQGKPSGLKTSLTLFELLDKFLTRHLNRVFWVSFCLTLLSGLLLFDIRISTAGDDSAYIMKAADFIHHFTLPGFHGPLYPILLGPFVWLFGIRVILLKFTSLIFMLGFVWLTYKGFKGRVPALLLTCMLVFVSVNSYILYYASQTYSEAFFMFLSALTFYVFFTLFIDDRNKLSFGVEIRHHLILAVCIVCMGFTRSIGLSAALVVFAYFVLEKQGKNILYFVLAFIIIITIFQGLKYILWGDSGFQFNEQSAELMNKDFYNPALGKEDFSGFFNRFILNSNQYFSGNLYAVLGLCGESQIGVLHPFPVALTYLILISAVILAYRKNKYLFFTGLYVITLLICTFFLLQPMLWQIRLIIPYIPMILLVFLTPIYFIFSLKKLLVFQWSFLILFMILIILTIRDTIPHIIANRQITTMYSGLTPDLKNYAKISEWASANLPNDAFIACRKPSISFIYGKGKHFYGIIRIPSYPGDSILLNWQNKHLHYYMISASSINNNPVSKELYFAFKNSVVGLGFDNDQNTHNVKFYIMDFADSIRTRTLSELYTSGITATSDLDSLKLILSDPGSRITFIYPDSLLQMFMRAKVTHVITANLRTTSMKTAYPNMTVERFMSYIEFKYPGIRTKLMQVGSDDDEPASVYKLNYELYGFRIPQ